MFNKFRLINLKLNALQPFPNPFIRLPNLNFQPHRLFDVLPRYSNQGLMNFAAAAAASNSVGKKVILKL